MPANAEPSALRRAWRPRLAVFGCTLIAYAGSLRGPFQFDDFGVIVDSEAVHSLSAYWAVAGHGLRPLLKLSYALCWALGGGPVAFHVVNLALHLLNVELVMRLYCAAVDRSGRWPFRSDSSGAYVAGLLFALHPIQTEAVTYISGRSSSLSTCFALACILLYVHAARSARGGLAFVASLLAFVCAVATKETIAAFPAALLLWELCIERPRWSALLRRQAAFWSLLLSLLVVAVMHPAYFKLLYEATGARPLLQSIGYQVAGTGSLLAHLAFVQRLSIDPGFGLQPPSQRAVFASAAVLATLLGLGVALRRSRPVVAFGLLWLLLQTLFPYVILQRLDVVNDRHMYLANVGVFMALGALWQGFFPRVSKQAGPLALAAALAVGLVLQTRARNADYRSAVALWESTVAASPANPRAHHNLGVAYESAGRIAEAVAQYRAALLLEPRYELARRHLERLSP